MGVVSFGHAAEGRHAVVDAAVAVFGRPPAAVVAVRLLHLHGHHQHDGGDTRIAAHAHGCVRVGGGRRRRHVGSPKAVEVITAFLAEVHLHEDDEGEQQEAAPNDRHRDEIGRDRGRRVGGVGHAVSDAFRGKSATFYSIYFFFRKERQESGAYLSPSGMKWC